MSTLKNLFHFIIMLDASLLNLPQTISYLITVIGNYDIFCATIRGKTFLLQVQAQRNRKFKVCRKLSVSYSHSNLFQSHYIHFSTTKHSFHSCWQLQLQPLTMLHCKIIYQCRFTQENVPPASSFLLPPTFP